MTNLLFFLDLPSDRRGGSKLVMTHRGLRCERGGRGSAINIHDRWVVTVVREVDMDCSHANGLYVTCKAVIMVAPSLEWQSASIADVGGELRVASHNVLPARTTGFTQGRPGVREG